MGGFFRDFRLFIARSNVLNLAVAVVIGAAFGSITTSLVDDTLMPPIGFLSSGVDFKDLTLRLNSEVVIRYGAFLNSVVNFVIVAFAIFVMVRAATTMQNFRRKEAESKASLPLEVALLQKIRDLLAAGQKPTGTPKPLAVAKTCQKSDLPSKPRARCGLSFS